MPHVTSRSWTERDIARLRQLSAQGASIVRAAAALNRKTSQVAKVARLHGISLVGTRQLKAAIRSLDPNAPFASYYGRSSAREDVRRKKECDTQVHDRKERPMDYRAYLVNPEGHFEGFEIIVADGDDKAVNIAKKLADKQVVEVWHLDRKLAVLHPDQQ